MKEKIYNCEISIKFSTKDEEVYYRGNILKKIKTWWNILKLKKKIIGTEIVLNKLYRIINDSAYFVKENESILIESYNKFNIIKNNETVKSIYIIYNN